MKRCIIRGMLKLAWITAPRWLSVVLFLVLGWIAVVALPELVASVRMPTLLLLASGGIAYSVGRSDVCARRPNPVPTVFQLLRGFHTCLRSKAAVYFHKHL